MNISDFQNLVESGHLRKSETNDLVLYTYTDLCTHEKNWNEFTRMARGLILEKKSGKVVGRPFPKFFNLGEMLESQLLNLPQTDYKVFEKYDGSLGIIYNYLGKWFVATKGSFNSEQAIKATEILKLYNLEYLRQDVTFLVEIIYPDNKIVVNYNGAEKLVLLAAFENQTGAEIKFEESPINDMELAKSYNYTIDKMIELQKTIPKDQEGFVVRFDNGLRVKIKGEEYLKIHRIIANLSPLSFWEVMENGKIPVSYIQQVPEEFKADFEPIVEKLEENYTKASLEINEDFKKLPTNEPTPQGRKEIGLFLKDNKLTHSQAMFSKLLDNKNALDGYIMKHIRPKANNLGDLY